MYLDDVGEVASLHVVVCLEEHLAKAALTDRVVLGVELVEPVERVAILPRSRVS